MNEYSQKLFAFLRRLRIGRILRLLAYARELNLLDKIKLNYSARYKPFKITFAGKDLWIVDTESFIGIYYEIFLDRSYAFRALDSSPTIIDGGANIGLATIFFKTLYPKSHITAFEPDPKICAVLHKNIGERRLSNVEVINAAIWSTDTELSFIAEGGASGHIASNDQTTAISVKALRLKSFLTKHIDFLKLDIEGSEYEVLDDCREELANVDHLFVEYHSSIRSEQKLADLLTILTKAGFRVHIREAFTSRQPFMQRQLMGDMDLQLNIWAFRTCI